MTRVLAWSRALLRNRLVHFLLLGGGLWLVAPAEKDGRRIVVTRTSMEDALAKARAERGRALATHEAREVLRDLVAERVLAAEGRRLALGDDDSIVNARLASLMGDLAEGTAKSSPPTAEEVSVERAGARPRLDVELAFIATERPGAQAEADALAKRLAQGEPLATGRFALAGVPARATWTETELARVVSPRVAEHAARAELGTWSPPIATAWGFYVVRVVSRRAPTDGELALEAAEAVSQKRRAAARRAAVARAARRYVLEVAPLEGAPAFDVRDFDEAGSPRGEDVD